MKKFNVERFIKDCGGPRKVAETLNKHRTAPYRMIYNGLMNTKHLEILLARHTHLKIELYFEEKHDTTKPRIAN